MLEGIQRYATLLKKNYAFLIYGIVIGILFMVLISDIAVTIGIFLSVMNNILTAFLLFRVTRRAGRPRKTEEQE